MKSNIIKATRTALDMNQTEFGVWIAKKTGRDNPFPFSRVSEWELGKRSPRKSVRDVCLPLVAGEIASDAVLEIAQCFLKNDSSALEIAMCKEILDVKNVIKNRIISETS